MWASSLASEPLAECPPLKIYTLKHNRRKQTCVFFKREKGILFDKCLHFVLPDVFLYHLMLSDFIFVSVRTVKMPAIVVSQLEPQHRLHSEMLSSWFYLNSELAVH